MSDKVQNALDILRAAGWTELGEQPRRLFKTNTQGSPVPNALIKTGGRMRLCLPGTNRRCTVGPRTTCFFIYDGRECSNFISVKTAEATAIKEHA